MPTATAGTRLVVEAPLPVPYPASTTMEAARTLARKAARLAIEREYHIPRSLAEWRDEDWSVHLPDANHSTPFLRLSCVAIVGGDG